MPAIRVRDGRRLPAPVVALLALGALAGVLAVGDAVSPVRADGARSAIAAGAPDAVPAPPAARGLGRRPAERPTALPASRPTGLRIPRIHVDTPLVDLGLAADGTLEVPADAAVAGWYVHAPQPGEPGPAVIAGHVDSHEGGGVFLRLRELRAGDVVEVSREDGRLARFRVTHAESYAKDAFPADQVYGPTPSAELRLITCGGRFDRSTRHYESNLVVYATLDSGHGPGR